MTLSTELGRRWCEFRNPSLKCERAGHVMQKRITRSYQQSDPGKDIFWLRYVAVRVVEETPHCSRCGMTEPTVEAERHGLHGLTMSEDQWERLRRNGRIPA